MCSWDVHPFSEFKRPKSERRTDESAVISSSEIVDPARILENALSNAPLRQGSVH